LLGIGHYDWRVTMTSSLDKWCLTIAILPVDNMFKIQQPAKYSIVVVTVRVDGLVYSDVQWYLAVIRHGFWVCTTLKQAFYKLLLTMMYGVMQGCHPIAVRHSQYSILSFVVG
jgi:hypothetical protein